MSVDRYEQMSTSVSDITSVALVTLEIINNTLLINELRLNFVCRELQFDNKKWGLPRLFLSYKRLKLKLRMFLAGHIVAMVTYCATKLTATYSPMIGQFVDTMMLVSTSIEWL